MEWKWTKGEPYERSRRKCAIYNNNVINEKDNNIEVDARKTNKEVEFSAYSSSLNYDENTWDILNQTQAGAGAAFKVSNKREELDTKIAGRDMVQQIGFNPFLGESSYVNDISIRDQFLKPVNTTQGENRATAKHS